LLEGGALAGAVRAGEIVPAAAAGFAFHADPLARGVAVGLAAALIARGARIAGLLDRPANVTSVASVIAEKPVGFEAEGEHRVSGTVRAPAAGIAIAARVDARIASVAARIRFANAGVRTLDRDQAGAGTLFGAALVAAVVAAFAWLARADEHFFASSDDWDLLATVGGLLIRRDARGEGGRVHAHRAALNRRRRVIHRRLGLAVAERTARGATSSRAAAVRRAHRAEPGRACSARASAACRRRAATVASAASSASAASAASAAARARTAAHATRRAGPARAARTATSAAPPGRGASARRAALGRGFAPSAVGLAAATGATARLRSRIGVRLARTAADDRAREQPPTNYLE